MAGLALRPVKGIDRLRCRFAVGIMAGDTAQRAPRSLPAAALSHLLHLADRLRSGGRRGRFVVDEDEERVIEVVARAEVVEAPAETGERRLAAEVALIADRLPPPRLQVDRVDDLQIVGLRTGRQRRHLRHMVGAWAVAALAADRRLGEDPRRIPLRAVGSVFHEPRMTVETAIPHAPFEAQPAVVFVAGGKPVSPRAAVPADRGLGEEAGLFDEIGAAAGA